MTPTLRCVATTHNIAADNDCDSDHVDGETMKMITPFNTPSYVLYTTNTFPVFQYYTLWRLY